MNEPTGEPIELVVSKEFAGARLDWFLAQQFPAFSRVQLRKAINAALVRVDGKRRKAAYHLQPGMRVRLQLPEPSHGGPQPEEIPIEVLYEDEHIAAVNKTPGMVVHPSRGHWSGTLASALQYHFNHLSEVGGPARPGIVHRLDRDTSGVLVVAKTDTAHMRLTEQFASREVEKEYFAIVVGRADRDRDVIDQPIGIHPHHREKMAVARGEDPRARPARTYYEVQQRFDGFTALRVFPQTGRTHQIRVHLASRHHPVLCDRLYGGRAVLTRGELSRDPADHTVLLDRQALHASRLSLRHPHTAAPLTFVAPLPEDLQRTLEALRQYRAL